MIFTSLTVAFALVAAYMAWQFYVGFRKRQKQFDEWEQRFGLAEALRRTAETTKSPRMRRKYQELYLKVWAIEGCRPRSNLP